jgi:hypothetical protein
MVEYTIYSCPKCDRFVDLVIYGISSGIGPPVGSCSKCSNKISTGRKEYESMSAKEKIKFFSASLLYIVFVGAAGWLFTYGGYKLLTEGSKAKGLDFGVNSILLMSVWAGSVILVQYLRLNESKKRFSENKRFSEISFPSVNFGLQITYCALMLAPLAIGGLFAYLRS